MFLIYTGDQGDVTKMFSMKVCDQFKTDSKNIKRFSKLHVLS